MYVLRSKSPAPETRPDTLDKQTSVSETLLRDRYGVLISLTTAPVLTCRLDSRISTCDSDPVTYGTRGPLHRVSSTPGNPGPPAPQRHHRAREALGCWASARWSPASSTSPRTVSPAPTAVASPTPCGVRRPRCARLAYRAGRPSTEPSVGDGLRSPVEGCGRRTATYSAETSSSTRLASSSGSHSAS